MTILADSFGWGPIMENILLVVHVVVCVLLCLVVLMQRPKQEGLGAAFGGGMTDQAFGARTTDVLQKGTVYLASLLFIVTLILSILVGTKSRDSSISKELAASGATAIDETGEAAAAMLKDADPEKLSADAIAKALKDATGEGEDKKEGEEGEKETPAPVEETTKPSDPTPAVEPVKPIPPVELGQ